MQQLSRAFHFYSPGVVGRCSAAGAGTGGWPVAVQRQLLVLLLLCIGSWMVKINYY